MTCVDAGVLAALQADPYGSLRDALETIRINRNVVYVCSGYSFEVFRDGYVPDLDDASTFVEADELVNSAAAACVDDWLSMTLAERKAYGA